MARPVAQDFLQTMRFQVIADKLDGNDPFQCAQRTEAGFTTCSIPTLSIEPVEYKEGTMIYTQKQPGIPSVDDVTLQRGVARVDTSFWKWMMTVVEGDNTTTGNYRTDIHIFQFDRSSSLLGEYPLLGTNATNTTVLNTDTAARIYHLRECFPTSVKPGGDLDASAAEISLQEMTIALENFQVEIKSEGV